MCVFYLTIDNDGNTFPKMSTYQKMSESRELIGEHPESEEDYALGDSNTFHFEYEAKLKRVGNFFATLDGVQMTLTTRSKKNKNTSSSVPI